MARQPRIEYPGAIYHVMNRGDRREPIVRGATDGELFVRTLGEACDKAGWQVHAFCLMPNHIHLVMETPQPDLCDGMKWFLGTYTNRFNRRHRLFGHLFSGRYKSLLVDDRDTAYLQTVCQYVHLNPGWKARRRHAVDCDLKSFFDTVNHDRLMDPLRKKVKDPRVLRLIRRYLQAGVVLPDGRREATPQGVPQGGPLSPLLANIVLDPLDKELEARGHWFARYADDFLVMVKRAKAAERVMASLRLR